MDAANFLSLKHSMKKKKIESTMLSNSHTEEMQIRYSKTAYAQYAYFVENIMPPVLAVHAQKRADSRNVEARKADTYLEQRANSPGV